MTARSTPTSSLREPAIALHRAGPLEKLLASRCRRRGGLTFAQFMQAALYHPRYGYYRSGKSPVGRCGDYLTAPEMHPAFAKTMANYLVRLWTEEGRPQRFTILEVGAGEGAFARDVLTHLQERHGTFWRALDYLMLDLKRPEDGRETPPQAPGGKLRRIRWRQLSRGMISGCIFSNEFFDALPTHRIVATASGLQEQYVTYASGVEWQESIGPLSRPQLAEAWRKFGTALQAGQSAELSLVTLRRAATLAAALRKGFMVTVDYGDVADRLYTPRRWNGTVMCYRNHQASDDPYRHIGGQDITAHVNFSMLIERGRELGLAEARFAGQGEFLIENGVLGFSPSGNTLAAQNARRAISALVLSELGRYESFRVLVQRKNASP